MFGKVLRSEMDTFSMLSPKLRVTWLDRGIALRLT